jgi:hypothetical protein
MTYNLWRTVRMPSVAKTAAAAPLAAAPAAAGA